MTTWRLRLIPLQELRLDQCKYPAKDAPTAIGGYLFCGRPVKPGEIYCREHKAICQQGRSQVQRAEFLTIDRAASKLIHVAERLGTHASLTRRRCGRGHCSSLSGRLRNPKRAFLRGRTTMSIVTLPCDSERRRAVSFDICGIYSDRVFLADLCADWSAIPRGGSGKSLFTNGAFKGVAPYHESFPFKVITAWILCDGKG
jgi:hypothetical protein